MLFSIWTCVYFLYFSFRLFDINYVLFSIWTCLCYLYFIFHLFHLNYVLFFYLDVSVILIF